jgi:integrase
MSQSAFAAKLPPKKPPQRDPALTGIRNGRGSGPAPPYGSSAGPLRPAECHPPLAHVSPGVTRGRRGPLAMGHVGFEGRPLACPAGQKWRGRPPHPLRGADLRALRQLQHADTGMAYVFVSERQSPLTTRTVYHIIAEAGRAAGFAFPIHPHMLRHACGFYLANTGVDTRALQQYLGHRNLQHTVRYTELTPQRFQNFWED